jgi:hypothetical protein
MDSRSYQFHANFFRDSISSGTFAVVLTPWQQIAYLLLGSHSATELPSIRPLATCQLLSSRVCTRFSLATYKPCRSVAIETLRTASNFQGLVWCTFVEYGRSPDHCKHALQLCRIQTWSRFGSWPAFGCSSDQ